MNDRQNRNCEINQNIFSAFLIENIFYIRKYFKDLLLIIYICTGH